MLVSVKWRLTSPVASLQLKPGHPPFSSPLLLFLTSPQQPPITGFITQLVVLVAPKRSWSNALRPAPSGARLGLSASTSIPLHSWLYPVSSAAFDGPLLLYKAFLLSHRHRYPTRLFGSSLLGCLRLIYSSSPAGLQRSATSPVVEPIRFFPI